MAGRGGGGRGRGRGMPMFMNKETKDLLAAHGIGRGDSIPPPLYDTSRFTKPQALLNDVDQDYLTRKRQMLRELAKLLPYQVRIEAKKKDVECFSDKYDKDHFTPLRPDWSLLPRELNTALRRKRKADVAKTTSRSEKPLKTLGVSQLEELEKNETEVQEEDDEPDGTTAEKKKPEGDEEDEEAIDEEDYDEAEYEEDNDYAKNYYESEDSHGGDDDDNEGDAY